MPVQIPYRECCQACARGRGVQAPHRRVQEREGLPVIQLDYFYPLGREEIKGLSVVDSNTGFGVSTNVEIPMLAECVCCCYDCRIYRGAWISRGDFAAGWRTNIGGLHSTSCTPLAGSRSSTSDPSGLVAVQLLCGTHGSSKALARALLVGVEMNYGGVLELNHPLVAWVNHVSWLHARWFTTQGRHS